MRKLSRELVDATKHIDVAWDAERQDRVLAGVVRLGRARKRRRIVLAGVMSLLLVGTGVRLLVTRGAPIAAVPPAPAPAPMSDDAVRLGARSFALPDVDAHFQRGDADLARLAGGRARFVVDEDRPLRLAAGAVVLEARAARFGVAVEGGRVEIRVEEGRVVVLEDGRRTELGPGTSSFPPEPPRRAAVVPSNADAREAAPAKPTPPRAAPAPVEEPVAAPVARTWRELAVEGDYDRAHAALVNDPTPPADATQLLLAADVARLSHHPAEALAPLHKILDEHAGDPRAQLAAFTLGRVLLDELGRPTEAAQAFARAVTLAPNGPLSEDAVAREIEAWSRAGETTRARALAEVYLRQFPDGRRARAVRRFGGLD